MWLSEKNQGAYLLFIFAKKTMGSVNKGTKVIAIHRVILEWNGREKERRKT